VRSLQGSASSYKVALVASSRVTCTAALVTGPVGCPAGAVQQYACGPSGVSASPYS
jgi:hypothetical protein